MLCRLCSSAVVAAAVVLAGVALAAGPRVIPEGQKPGDVRLQPPKDLNGYFPFDPPRPVVGLWLAVTEATLENGCLHVLPGSHRETVHEHVPDRRPGANYGYMEIVDHDMSGSVPVCMQPGDLLLFDSHLMHRSTDNQTSGIRAAMVYHYALAGSVDHTERLKGYTVNDWMPVRRST